MCFLLELVAQLLVVRGEARGVVAVARRHVPQAPVVVPQPVHVPLPRRRALAQLLGRVPRRARLALRRRAQLALRTQLGARLAQGRHLRLLQLDHGSQRTDLTTLHVAS